MSSPSTIRFIRSLGVLFGVAWLSLVHPAAAFRTELDTGDFHQNAPVAWPEGWVLFHVELENLPAAINEDSFRVAVDEAASRWTEVNCAGLEIEFAFEPISLSEENSIRFVLGSPWPEHHGVSRTVSAFAPSRRGGWVMSGASIELQHSGVEWNEELLSNVMTHEFGHAIGLRHSCGEGDASECDDEHQTDPMRPTLGVDDGPLTVGEDSGVCFLYPNQPDGLLPDGDLCRESAECRGGACSPDGVCLTACVENTNCGAWAECVQGGCFFAEAGEFGATCDDAAQCVSGLCEQSEGICSRSCEFDVCPSGQMCSGQGKAICVLPAAESGCAYTAQRARSLTLSAVLGALGFGLLLLFRRARKVQ